MANANITLLYNQPKGFRVDGKNASNTAIRPITNIQFTKGTNGASLEILPVAGDGGDYTAKDLSTTLNTTVRVDFTAVNEIGGAVNGFVIFVLTAPDPATSLEITEKP